MEKDDSVNESSERINRKKSMHWELVKKEMTEDEVENIKNMNWEWYYNSYLYKDEPVQIVCKICGGINTLLPGEKKKRCLHCGIECRRCEVDEDER